MLAYEGTEKSEILNKYFCSISNIDDANKDLPEFDDRCHDFLSQIIVSEQDVLDIVSTLDPNKAVEPDIVSNRMVLAVRHEISKPLCLLFDKSLHDGVFPDQRKIAYVIPLFKIEEKHRHLLKLCPHEKNLRIGNSTNYSVCLRLIYTVKRCTRLKSIDSLQKVSFCFHVFILKLYVSMKYLMC
ncbi:Hypothetical predicted protein [Mytilus galloprovincialis]|uniref:Uncharacterized protein n=1 Tax=Mytilus galloprovincialis TaxID=29158 RepID=A0A8B6HSI7_MYTGA|nr:Hypothetical predicted protein [Mytilus galloprovincialis]